MAAVKEKPVKQKTPTAAQAKKAAAATSAEASPNVKKTRAAKKPKEAAGDAPAENPAPRRQSAPSSMLDVAVKFNNVSLGDTTARMGFKVDRSVLKLSQADNLFVNRRLNCVVVLGHTDEQPGETKLFEDDVVTIAGSCDVKGFRATADTFNAALTFSLRDVDVATLAKFSKGAGRLRILGASEIPDEEPSYDGDDDSDLFGEE